MAALWARHRAGRPGLSIHCPGGWAGEHRAVRRVMMLRLCPGLQAAPCHLSVFPCRNWDGPERPAPPRRFTISPPAPLCATAAKLAGEWRARRRQVGLLGSWAQQSSKTRAAGAARSTATAWLSSSVAAAAAACARFAWCWARTAVTRLVWRWRRRRRACRWGRGGVSPGAAGGEGRTGSH